MLSVDRSLQIVRSKYDPKLDFYVIFGFPCVGPFHVGLDWQQSAESCRLLCSEGRRIAE